MSLAAVRSFLISRNVVLLAVCQALANTLQTMGIATTPLVAYAFLGVDKSWATLPLVFTHIGLMIATIPASFLMARIGRKAGFTVGALIGILAGGVGVVAVYQQSFWLLCLTATLQGMSIACAWYYRFAAADAAPMHLKARAISLVLFGGIMSGVIGAEAAKWAKDMLAPVTFAGIYVMFAVMCGLTLMILQFLAIPPPTRAEQSGPSRPLGEIMRQPNFIVAVLSSMMGFGVMTVMMASTPLAMQGCGFTFAESATVIQVHAVAMYAPALFTGYLINRFGVLVIIAIGAIAQLGCLLVAMSGIGFGHFMLANILVGIGWNFCFIGGTTLLTTVYRPSELAKTQAAHDFLQYVTTMIAAGVSGIILAGAGWSFVNLAALPMVVIAVAAVVWLFAKAGNVSVATQAALRSATRKGPGSAGALVKFAPILIASDRDARLDPRLELDLLHERADVAARPPCRR